VGAGLGPRCVLVAGVSPRRALDDRYRGFFELIADHLATTIGNARIREEQRRGADAVAAQWRTLYALFEQVPASIAVLRGEQLVYEMANRRYLETSGHGREMMGKPALEVRPELGERGIARMFEGVRRTGVPCVVDELEIDGRWWSCVFAPLAGAGEGIERVISFSYEVTDLVLARRRAEAAVTDEVRARRELASVVEYNEKFTAMLGHDLRNPLNAIATAAQLLERRATVPEIARPAQRIVFSVERMSRMIGQLLDLARVRVTGLHLQRRELDLAELCQLVLDELRQGKPGSQIELETVGSLHGRWDGDRLAQVISNLAGNALEHGEPGAPVRVQLDGRESGRVALRVENRGAIDGDVLPTLFDPFRGARHRRENTRGLGLGLYISKEIVAAHGGTIEVRSSADSGTRFAIELPRNAEAAP
jgi:signal transduction histidine kinase